jgi:serine/threonine protein kinase
MFASKSFKLAMDDKDVLTKLIDTEIDLLKDLSHPNIVSFHELLKEGDGHRTALEAILRLCSVTLGHPCGMATCARRSYTRLLPIS